MTVAIFLGYYDKTIGWVLAAAFASVLLGAVLLCAVLPRVSGVEKFSKKMSSGAQNLLAISRAKDCLNGENSKCIGFNASHFSINNTDAKKVGIYAWKKQTNQHVN